jgi:Mrp family chromosome partitioning ATPase
MGRTLDALRQAEAPTRSHAAQTVADMNVANSSVDPLIEEMPFIEVGAANGGLEASPAVLAARIENRASHLAAERPQTSRPAPSQAVDTDPRTIAFQALPAPALPCGPAEKRISPHVVAYHQPDHPVSQQYRALLTAVRAQLTPDLGQVALLASDAPATGVTTVLLNLAVTHARELGKPTAVVDVNLHRPGLAQSLGVSAGPGVREVLSGRFPLTRALQETGQPNLWLLAGGYERGPDWPAARPLRELLRQLRRRFSIVFVDAPAWQDGPEMASLHPACDAVFLVVRPHEVDSPRVGELVRLVPHLGSYVGGYIVTRR